MYKERITDKEAISIFIIFIIGTSLIIGLGAEAKNDSWIAAIIGLVASVPFILMYSRLVVLFPGKDLFEISRLIFGNIIGTMLSFIYVWYAFHLGALVFRNFGEFVNTLIMPETPMLAIILLLGVVTIAVVRSGIEVLARISAGALPVILIILFLVQMLSLNQLNLENIKPFFGNGLVPILKGAFSSFSFPFAETVLFTGVLYSLKKRKSSYKVYFTGLFIGAFIILVVIIRNIMLLGDARNIVYFPSYIAVSRIELGDFIERIEITVSFVLVFGALIKGSVCLLTACRGLANIFRLKDYKSIVIQTGLIMVYFSYSLYGSILEMQYWAFKVYSYYAFPFQVLLPLIIWITAETKVKRKKIA